MEEKKLTDEEIIKALDFCYSSPCCGSGCPYFNKHGRNFCVEDKALYKDMKRIVLEHAEQKAEIERLTEEKEDLYFQNKNLQTYIDNHEPIWERNKEQAVKDTAKEIFDSMTGEFECYIPIEIAKEICKKYGVEVE